MNPVPAAQYLRMSTEHQQYSLANQADAIARYANEHGFAVVKTYDDPGKSGLQLRHRKGLKQLLEDVISGGQPYRAILVYDVSRWGRFQDTDEAAHYEFVCKQAGIPVHYCAETFQNDASMSSLIMKTLKRVMAGEYSRELSIRMYAAKKRLALLGYRQGAAPGFGLRRMLVSVDNQRNRILQHGEFKGLMTDHVILVPGPESEVCTVREIYRLVVKRHMRIAQITRLLNKRHVPLASGRRWTMNVVADILRNPKYMGWNIWGRTAQKLRGPAVRVAREQWAVNERAFRPLIDQRTFQAAQRVLAIHDKEMPEAEMLARLHRLFVKKGRLSRDIIIAAGRVPSPTRYCQRFGSLSRAYQQIGYGRSNAELARISSGRKTRRLVDAFVQSLAKNNPAITVQPRRYPHDRVKILLPEGVFFTLVVYRFTTQGGSCWQINKKGLNELGPFLLCLMNARRTAFEHLLLVPDLNSLRCRSRVVKGEAWPDSAVVLENIADFASAAATVAARMNTARALNGQ